MKFSEFEQKYINPFKEIHYIFNEDEGFIVWKVGTGENVELLHIRAFELRKGYATSLIMQMLQELEKQPPYYSIFGFALAGKKDIEEIYNKLGFETVTIPAPYKDDKAIMFYQSYENLRDKYL